jgi:hypothetical protein
MTTDTQKTAARRRRGCKEPLDGFGDNQNPKPPNSSAFCCGIAHRVAHSKVGYLYAKPQPHSRAMRVRPEAAKLPAKEPAYSVLSTVLIQNI